VIQKVSNRERIAHDQLLEKLSALLFTYHGIIRLSILKNIVLVTYALLNLFSGARGSNGWLSKAALARCLPLETGPKTREQRLYRFLANPRFTPEVMIPLLVALACGTHPPGPIPLILDQTSIRGIPTLLIGLVFEGRVIPVAFSCFIYSRIQKSQNILEHALILAVMSCFPAKQRPWLIMDRGYARVGLLMKLGLEGIPFLVRAKRNVLVYWKGKPIALGRLSVKAGQIHRYSIHYHSKKKEPLDLIIFHGKGYKEPWYLLVPANTPESAEEIVALYAKRMSIEQGFRDWKTHLGIRGMVFVNDNPAPRLTRLLLAFSLSYLLCLALGSTADSQLVRAFVEIPRRTPRHGTTRTLSSLYIGILRLSLPKFSSPAHIEILAIIQRLLSGKGLLSAGLPPP
jgi:hypothetical protein